MTSPALIAKLKADVGEFIARHERREDARDFEKYADDPAGFLREVLKCEPWSKQIEMALSVRDHPRSVIVTCNGLGKDWITARIALWWIYACRGFVVLTGPTERQVKQICMREVRKAFARAPELPGELFALELRVDEAGECGLLAFTSDNADKLTGFHHPRLLICVTEGQGVEDEAYEAALSCSTGPGNRLFVYGNPTNRVGQFYRAATSDAWHVLTIGAHEHPNVISGREEIPGAVSREFIAMMAEEYGESSSIYRSRVLAQFPEDSIEGLVKRAWLLAAFERFEQEDPNAGLDLNEARPRALLSLDVARFGADSSCLVRSRRSRVEELITWREATITDSAARLLEHADRWSVRSPRASLAANAARLRPELIVDGAGLGGGVVDIVRQHGWEVHEFNGGNASSDSSRFLNLRAESHWRFRELLENNTIALPRDAALEEEALAIEWQLTASSSIQIVGKDAVRKAIGRSPDRLDAVIMAMWKAYTPTRQWGQGRFTV